MSAAPRGLSRPHASFIGTVCQGIHHCALHDNQPTNPKKGQRDRRREHTTKNTKCVQLEHSTIRSSHTSTTPQQGHGRHETNERTHTPPHTAGMHPGHTNQTQRIRPMRLGSFTVRTPTTPQTKGMAAARVHSPVLKPPPHHKPRTTPTDTAHDPWARNHTPHQKGGVAVREPNSTHHTTPTQTGGIHDLFHTSRDDPHPQGRATSHPTNRHPTRAPHKTP